MRFRYQAATLVFILFFVLIRFVTDTDDYLPGRYLVTKVIDGDSVELNGNEKLRLLGIDCPEKGDIFHDSALAVLSKLVLNREITLKFDNRRRDGYGRLLAYIYVDTLLVNAYILRNGLAAVYLFPDNQKNVAMSNRLIEAQREAILENRGIWSLPVTLEDHYIGNPKSLRFHRPDCGAAINLSESRRVVYDSRTDPLFEGLSPCRNCKP